MLSQGSVTNAWKNSDKSEFKTLFDFKMAMLTLQGAIHKVMPWNYTFQTVYIFLVSVDFGESILSGKARIQFLTNFVDEALRANARNWEEKKKFLSNQDHLTRKGALIKPTRGEGGQIQSKAGGRGQREEKGVILGFQSKCSSKDNRHASDWNPNFYLKHVCNKRVNDKNKHCLEGHKRADHK